MITYQLHHLLSVQVYHMKMAEFASNMLKMTTSHALQLVLSNYNYFQSYQQLVLAYYTDWKS